MKKKVALLILVLTLALMVAAQPGVSEDDGTLGSLHEYAPYSFWSNAAVFLDDPAMDEAWQAIATAAADMGKTCYDWVQGGPDKVKAFMSDMFAADFHALAVSKDKTFTYYGPDGAIEAMCRYWYLGSETVMWGEYPVEWHRYERAFCVPRPTSHFRHHVRTPYKYLVATPVHQHGDGMIHAHLRYGNTGFYDLLSNPDYTMWWPTMALYGATTAESLAVDMTASPAEFAGMLPPCPAETGD